jgi:hypothetical protein
MNTVSMRALQRHLAYRIAELNRTNLFKRAYDITYRDNHEDIPDLVAESIICGVRLCLFSDARECPKTGVAK